MNFEVDEVWDKPGKSHYHVIIMSYIQVLSARSNCDLFLNLVKR